LLGAEAPFTRFRLVLGALAPEVTTIIGDFVPEPGAEAPEEHLGAAAPVDDLTLLLLLLRLGALAPNDSMNPEAEAPDGLRLGAEAPIGGLMISALFTLRVGAIVSVLLGVNDDLFDGNGESEARRDIARRIALIIPLSGELSSGLT
jgi:hypothetical protein